MESRQTNFLAQSSARFWTCDWKHWSADFSRIDDRPSFYSQGISLLVETCRSLIKTNAVNLTYLCSLGTLVGSNHPPEPRPALDIRA
jgi:hypothetical protein